MEKRNLVFLGLAVVALKMAFFMQVIQNPALAVSFGDPQHYYDLAKGLAYDHTLNSPFRPIIYPLIFAIYILAFGKLAPLVLVFTQYILSAFIGWAIYQIVYQLSDDRRKAILGFAFYTLNPVITLYESATYSETFAIFFLAVGSLSYFRRRYLFAGLLFGLSALVRPAALTLVFIPLLFLLVDRNLPGVKERVRAFTYMIVAVAVTVFPWAARNYVTYDRFFLSTSGEYTLGLYQINYVYADVKNIDIVKAREEWLTHVFDEGHFDKKYPRPDLAKFKNNSAYWEYQDYPDIGLVGYNEAVKVYLAHPFTVAKFAITGMSLSFLNPALWPMSYFWGHEIDHSARTRLVESVYRFRFQDISATDVLPFLNLSIVLSASHVALSFLLLALVVRNVVSGRVSAVMLLMFLLSWFIAGFAGTGASRYFMYTYTFFIVSALGCRSAPQHYGMHSAA